MIDYPRQKWLPLVLRLEGTVIPRVALRVLVVTAVAAGVSWLYEGGGFRPNLTPVAHNLIGVALGLLLVFRTNASYDRYWEGRKQWGALVNSSRNLVRAVDAYCEGAEDFVRLVPAFALALKQHLRADPDLTEVAAQLHPEEHTRVTASRPGGAPANVPVMVAREMSRRLAGYVAAGRLQPQILRSVEIHVAALLDAQGACERILRTPMPFAYVVQIRQILTLYLVTLPVFVVPALGWITVPAVACIAFGLLGIEEIGVEIEDPFGTDPNDLPLDRLCATVAADAAALAAR